MLTVNSTLRDRAQLLFYRFVVVYVQAFSVTDQIVCTNVGTIFCSYKYCSDAETDHTSVLMFCNFVTCVIQ